MQSRKMCLGVLACIFAVYAVQAGKPSRIEKDVPIFPGAQRDQAAEREYREQMELPDDEAAGGTEVVRIYSSTSPVEDVSAFYIEKLNAKEGFPEEGPDPSRPETLRPCYELDFYEESDFENQHEFGDKIYDGQWVKTSISSRKTWQNGRWVRAASLEWYAPGGNRETALHSVSVEDDGFDYYNKKYRQKTLITIIIRAD